MDPKGMPPTPSEAVEPAGPASKTRKSVLVIRTGPEGLRESLSNASTASSTPDEETGTTVVAVPDLDSSKLRTSATHDKAPPAPEVVVAPPVPLAADESAAAAAVVAPTLAAERSRWLFNYLLMPLALPLLLAYFLGALLLASLATWTILPSLLLARRLYWACPFIPNIWRSEGVRGRFGWLGSWCLQLQFEGAHSITVISRLLTLPMRPHLPDFYIVGFPKCGTTSLAAYLKRHPALSGLSGMPGHETLSKESHFFMGLLGREAASSSTLYRSFFPTILTRWWAEAVRGVPRWMCFDACPTYACLPHVPARVHQVTPKAKIIFIVRDPCEGVFSAETMLRNMGCPLEWSLAGPVAPAAAPTAAAAAAAVGGDVEAQQRLVLDERFQETEEQARYWEQLGQLAPDAPLPEDLPARFYFDLHSYLAAGQYSRRLKPWFDLFPKENIMLIEFRAFVKDPEQVVRRVLEFLGVEQDRYVFKQQPPSMATDYRGRSIHHSVVQLLSSTWFRESNAAMGELLGMDLADWGRSKVA